MVTMEDSILHLTPTGELTIYQVEEMTKQVILLFDNAKELVINMTQTDKIDTAGFQLLVSLKKSCETTQKRFELVGISDSAQNFMTLFGYEWDFEHKGDR